MSERRHPNIVNRDELEPNDVKKGKHHVINRRFGIAAGSAQLGGTLNELPPGALSYPLHYHCANEEAVYALAGTGTARIGDEGIAIRAGDWIAFPSGPAHAHQMINDSAEPLVYLGVTTRHNCEVVGYPESKKVAAWAGTSPTQPWIRQIVREGETLDYWDSEPAAH